MVDDSLGEDHGVEVSCPGGHHFESSIPAYGSCGGCDHEMRKRLVLWIKYVRMSRNSFVHVSTNNWHPSNMRWVPLDSILYLLHGGF